MKKRKIGDKSVTLTLTESCNLSCVYCYEKHKQNKSMTFETAKKILDYELNTDDGFDHVLIDFFGGEPFLEFETMKKIVEYLKGHEFKKTYELYAITNGILIHGKIKDWLVENKKLIDVSLSLDGDRLMHNLNRGNSFDLIDLDFFSENYGKHGIKMTISPQTLPYLSQGVIFCQEKGFNVYCNLAFGIDWSEEKNILTLSEELQKLINYYLDHPEYQPCSILDFNINLLGYENTDSKHYKWCGVKSHMHTYDTQGKNYPCQYFMGLACGEDNEKTSENIDFPEEVSIQVINKECQKCAINILCPTCYGANYVYSGNIYIKDMSMCEVNKIIILARSYFKYYQWKNKLVHLSNEEEFLLLKSIKKIQTELI